MNEKTALKARAVVAADRRPNRGLWLRRPRRSQGPGTGRLLRCGTPMPCRQSQSIRRRSTRLPFPRVGSGQLRSQQAIADAAPALGPQRRHAIESDLFGDLREAAMDEVIPAIVRRILRAAPAADVKA